MRVASLARGTLPFQLYEDQLEGLVAYILGQVLATSVPLHRSRLHGVSNRLSVGQGEFPIGVRQEHGYVRRMLMHHRFFVGP